MPKKWLVILFFIFFCLIYYFFGKSIQAALLPIGAQNRSFFYSFTDNFSNAYDKYIAQSNAIERLKKENYELKKSAISFKPFLKLQNDELFLKDNLPTNPPGFELTRVKVLSYSNLPNLYRLWIDYEPKIVDENEKKIRGLIYPTINHTDSVACGIAIETNDGSFEAYLNGDAKSSYAVFIGKQKAPGILFGKNQNLLSVKYIPTWLEIKEGDEVVTSGLDGLFFEGVKVGTIKKVFGDNAYKEAHVLPYFNPLNPSYFYLLEKQIKSK